MNCAWKIPLGYFLINGITAEQKSNLIYQSLHLLNESGVKVLAITFDGAASNLSAATKLGCNLNPNMLQPWFINPASNENIFIYPDPYHMIKLVRNAFGYLKAFKHAGDSEYIRWEYIESLNNLQEWEGLHLANKLRKAHLEYYKQKMKVRLATQLLSRSVSDSLEVCKNDLKLVQFRHCGSTINFIRIFNDLFDILNSKNIHQFGYKQAIHEGNCNSIFMKLEECRDYIHNLHLLNDVNILNSARKTGLG